MQEVGLRSNLAGQLSGSLLHLRVMMSVCACPSLALSSSLSLALFVLLAALSRCSAALLALAYRLACLLCPTHYSLHRTSSCSTYYL
eukprot:COSAG05_NODE_2981_length_2437_cov_1.493584_3_plen_87_part_00